MTFINPPTVQLERNEDGTYTAKNAMAKVLSRICKTDGWLSEGDRILIEEGMGFKVELVGGAPPMKLSELVKRQNEAYLKRKNMSAGVVPAKHFQDQM